MKKITIAFFAFTCLASAQDGVSDAAFGTDGAVIVPGTNVLFHEEVLSGGKLLYQNSNVIKRLTAAGQEDTAFGAAGSLTLTQPGTDAYYHLLVQNDKILAFSNTSVSFPSTETYYAGRYNADGSIDSGFGSAGTGWVTLDMGNTKSGIIPTIQGDGFVVAGNTVVNSGSYNNVVARKFLLSDGSLIAFNPSTSSGLNLSSSSQGYATTDGALDGIVLPNGDYVMLVNAAYYLTTGFYYASGGFVRIRENVSTPTIRINSTKAYYGGVKADICTDASSNIYVLAGVRMSASNQPAPTSIIYRYDSSAALDDSFGNSGALSLALPISGASVDFSKMAVQGDGKILMAGVTTTSSSIYVNANLVLARFLVDGSLDTSFGTDGYVTYDIPHPNSAANHNTVTGLFLSADGSEIYLTGKNYENSVILKYGNDSQLRAASFEVSASSVYPNPASGYVHINSARHISKVDVYNMLGQQVLSKTMLADENSFDISGLQRGSYMAKLSCDGKTETVRLVKE